LNVATQNTAVGNWSLQNGPGNAWFLPDENIPDALLQVDAFGAYTLQWTAVNGACIQTADMDIEFLKPPDVEAGSDVTIEMGERIQLNGSGGDSVSWSPIYRLSDPTVPDPFADPLITTTYYLTAFNIAGCQAKDSVTVTVTPPDFAEAGEDTTLCPGDSVQLKASGGDLFRWEPVEGLSNPEIPDPWVRPNMTNTYIVHVTRSDGITDSDTVTIFVRSRPFVDAGNNQSICLGETVRLSANGAGEFRWLPATLFADPFAQSPEVIIDTTTTFLVRIRDEYGCRNADTVTVFVYTPPVADAGTDQEYIAIFETTLEASLGPGETGIWTVISGQGFIESPQDPGTFVTHLAVGDHLFEWTVSNGVCPEATDQVLVRILDFVIPTVITPNGDGKNDFFHIEGIESFTRSELIVLNRWGETIYQASPYENNWSGANMKGEALPEETYYIIIRLSDADIRKGYVKIVR
jgi:gliding motility-associated-like protein